VRLLGGVDQQEEKRERSSDYRALADAQLIDLSQQIFERRRVRLGAPARARGDPQALDDLERLLALEPVNDTAERAGEPSNVLVEWKIFVARGAKIRCPRGFHVA